jgi:hypothetical protein
VLLLCSVAQATNLLITVQDSIDNSTVYCATVFIDGTEYARINNNEHLLYVHTDTNNKLIRFCMA